MSDPPGPIVISHQQNRPLNIRAIDIIDPDVTETVEGTLIVTLAVTTGRLDVLPGLPGGLAASHISGNGSNQLTQVNFKATSGLSCVIDT